jgi:hypothetical protein
MTGSGTFRWLKSSYSDGGGGNCVEVAQDVDAIHIRDSKNPGGAVITVCGDAWCGFLAAPPTPSPEKP